MRAPKPGTRRNAERDMRLTFLAAKGVPRWTIAQLFDVTPADVSRRARRLGLPSPAAYRAAMSQRRSDDAGGRHER